jgi:hypothetical protein
MVTVPIKQFHRSSCRRLMKKSIGLSAQILTGRRAAEGYYNYFHSYTLLHISGLHNSYKLFFLRQRDLGS